MQMTMGHARAIIWLIAAVVVAASVGPADAALLPGEYANCQQTTPLPSRVEHTRLYETFRKAEDLADLAYRSFVIVDEIDDFSVLCREPF
jgi:hypothetical protein